jgi:hypothetical protein
MAAPMECAMDRKSFPYLFDQYYNTVGIEWPGLSSKENHAMIQYLNEFDKELLRSAVIGLAKSGETLSPHFGLFLADVMTGRLDRPDKRKKTNYAKDYDIITELQDCLRKDRLTSIRSKRGECVVANLAEKFGVTESHVVHLFYRWRKDWLRFNDGERLFKENLKPSK